jgi:hypothetical protein
VGPQERARIPREMINGIGAPAKLAGILAKGAVTLFKCARTITKGVVILMEGGRILLEGGGILLEGGGILVKKVFWTAWLAVQGQRIGGSRLRLQGRASRFALARTGGRRQFPSPR